MMDRFAVYTLQDEPDVEVVVLSYPGVEQNGTVIVAPLVTEDGIAIVQILHPIVETPHGKRVVAIERLSAMAPRFLGNQTGSLAEYEYDISRALSRLFFGN